MKIIITKVNNKKYEMQFDDFLFYESTFVSIAEKYNLIKLPNSYHEDSLKGGELRHKTSLRKKEKNILLNYKSNKIQIKKIESELLSIISSEYVLYPNNKLENLLKCMSLGYEGLQAPYLYLKSLNFNEINFIEIVRDDNAKRESIYDNNKLSSKRINP